MWRIICISLLLITLCSCQPAKENTLSSQFYTDSIYSKALGEYRQHNIYLPQNFDANQHYPIIYATDGSNNIRGNLYKKGLDSLITNNITKPFIYVASHYNSKIADSTSTTKGAGEKVFLRYRNFEYIREQASKEHSIDLRNRFNNHLDYFTKELIPTIEKELNQGISKQDRYFYGYSNGAGFGIELFNSRADIIGTYLCFSTFGPYMPSLSWKENIKYPNLYLRYGSEEPFFLDEDAAYLKEKSQEYNFFMDRKEFNGGHDGSIWLTEFMELIGELLK